MDLEANVRMTWAKSAVSYKATIPGEAIIRSSGKGGLTSSGRNKRTASMSREN